MEDSIIMNDNKENIPPSYTSSNQIITNPNAQFYGKYRKCRRINNNRIPLEDITHLFNSSSAAQSSSVVVVVVDVPKFRKRKGLQIDDGDDLKHRTKSLRINFR
ncbi:hypothetical protein RND81_04G025300 [Saponaria officinalis]|uniref:Uncharacterized protein n=1 Tax=Saponaria officinalis TaxID=3572 RepID=A0AAW1LCL7_SAPOF